MRRLNSESERLTGREPAEAEARAEMLRRAHDQQAGLATSFADLLGDGDPAYETADEMIRAIRRWRDMP